MDSAPTLDPPRAWLRPSLLFAAIALVGVAYICALPPWEGFDETAHWSSIQEIADTGRIPVRGDTLSADRLNYFGPEPRGVDKRGRSYQNLREHPPASTGGGPGRYRPDPGVPNWQTQHPPLYYVFMAPLYRLAHGLGWVDHLLVLRLVSWCLALSGLWLGYLAVRRTETEASEPCVGSTAVLVFPLLFPGFFADLARIGNDSLCLLVFGALWWWLLPLLAAPGDAEGRPRSALAIGALLGCGLWTKAFFIPIALGVGVLLTVRALRSRSRAQRIDAAFAIGLAVAMGAGWYLAKLATTGALSGSDEAAQLLQTGGVLHGLATHFSAGSLVRSLGVAVATVGWPGSWSLIRLPAAAFLPSVALLVSLAVGYALHLKRDRRLIAWAPAAIVLPFLLGLGWHAVIRMALDGSGAGTPGWYLHVIAPALGMTLALGWRWPKWQWPLAAAAAVCALASWGLELSVFSGCTPMDAAGRPELSLAACGIDLNALARLGHPYLAASALTGALALIAWVCVEAWRGRTPVDDGLQQLT